MGGRITYEDDLVVVYDQFGDVVYQGMEDYNPYKDEDWIYDEGDQRYHLSSSYGDYTMECLT